jgi:hypothetical protein
MIAYNGSLRLVYFVAALILFESVGLSSASAQPECSVATLTGEYTLTGVVQARLDQRDDPTFPRINVGYWTFDGKGDMSTFIIQNQGGQLRRTEETATYTMDSKRCVATVTFPLGATFDVIVARDGSEGDAIRTDGSEGQVIITTRHLKRR